MLAIRRTYKYRLYRHRRNKHLMRGIDIAGIIWNHMVALQRRYYRLTGGYIGKSQMQRHLLKLRRQAPRFAYWRELGSQTVQELAERLHKAYEKFFAYKKGEKGVKAGVPHFKKVKKYKSFTLKQAGWKLLGEEPRKSNRIQIGKRVYKFGLSREIKGKIKTVTVKRDQLGQLWVCFSVVEQVTIPEEVSTGQIGGFDFGLKTYLTGSDGQRIEAPEYFKAGMKGIAKLNRELARKVKGSNNWHKTKQRLAKEHQRIANKRADFHWKLAHHLADQFDYLFFETLNLKGMKALWGRKVSDLGFATFLPIQEHVCQKRGKGFKQVGQWEPTTKPCCRCGTKQDLPLSERIFDCQQCGLLIDRDWNAAINICAEGASSAGLGDVRQRLLSAITV